MSKDKRHKRDEIKEILPVRKNRPNPARRRVIEEEEDEYFRRVKSDPDYFEYQEEEQ